MAKKRKSATTKIRPAPKKRAKNKDSVTQAKKDARNFAKSVASFIPGIGTILGIQSAYDDGMKLLESGPQALKELGKKSKERIKSQIKERLKRR